MKQIITKVLSALIAVVFSLSMAIAQAPQALSYQAVVRNANGNVVANKTIALRFSIRDVSATGTVVYQETQNAITNVLGLFSTNVGQGSLVNGSLPFSVISWDGGNKYLQVEIDTAGSSNYFNMGTQQLVSTPYALSAGNGVPAGTVVAYAGGTVPAGWLLCDGSLISRTVYKNLFAAINTIYGFGDNSTTFGLPDYRGMFLRGKDWGAGVDPDAKNVTLRFAANNSTGQAGDAVGSIQKDAFQNHTHKYNANLYNIALTSGTLGVYDQGPTGNTTITQQNTGGNETRPINVYVNYIIKY